MAETIPCTLADDCNCQCNCQAVLANGRIITVGDLTIDGNDYTFNYTITNIDPALSFAIFCIECPTSKFEASDLNTVLQITGFIGDIPVVFSEDCTQPPPDNTYCPEFEFGDEEVCCALQGLKINTTPADDITSILFEITFTLPEGLSLTFTPGVVKIKSSTILDVINYICLPGCCEESCNICQAICKIWGNEQLIIEKKQQVYTHLSQLILPPGTDLSSLTLDQIQQIVSQLCKLNCCIGNLDACTAKVLEALNSLREAKCKDNCPDC